MAEIIEWPSILKPIDAIFPYLEGQSKSAGTTIGGQSRPLGTMTAKWRYGFRFKIRSVEQALAWRGVVALSDGQTNVIRVPICDCRYSLNLAPPPPVIIPRIPFSDGTFFSDGTGWANGGGNFAGASYAPALSTSLRVDLGVAAQIRAGHFFSTGDRLYQIKTATPISGSVYTLTFSPPLRSEILEGSEIQFKNLSCLMRFSSEEIIRTEMMLLRFGDMKVEFEEVIT